MRCRGLQNPHSWAAFSAPGCPVLHGIAFPVVSEWCQKDADFTSQFVFRAGRGPHLLRGDRARRRASTQQALTLGTLPMLVSVEANIEKVDCSVPVVGVLPSLSAKSCSLRIGYPCSQLNHM